MLSQAEDVCYIFEPFNLRIHKDSPFEDLVRGYNRRPDFWMDGGPATTSDPQAAAVRSHLRWLITTTFPSPASTLIVKQPDTERIPFLVEALGVDQVIYVRRHPLGIINSYYDSDLFGAWDVDGEFGRTASAFPDLGIDVDLSRCVSSQDKLSALIHTRFSLLRRALPPPSERHLVVSYENLCIAGLPAFGDVFASLGLGWGQQVETRLNETLNVPNHTRSGFHTVDVNSLSRAQAWRRELHPKQIERFATFVTAMGISGYSLPGDGLPPLTASERAAGRRSYWTRRFGHTTTVRRAKKLLQKRDTGAAGRT
jgi:hypothetical protein